MAGMSRRLLKEFSGCFNVVRNSIKSANPCNESVFCKPSGMRDTALPR